MMRLISITEMGSTPANGSSSRMNLGFAASARAISTRRRSPPESLAAIAQVFDVEFFHQLFSAIFTLLAAEIVADL